MTKTNTKQEEKKDQRKCVVIVPEPIRNWIDSANEFNKAAGQRPFSVYLVMDAILDGIAKSGQFVDVLGKVDPETLMDYRGRKKKQQD